jgi:hypothetical protein
MHSSNSTTVPLRARPRDATLRVVVISCDVAASALWTTRLRGNFPFGVTLRPWGDQLGYEHLHRGPGVLALLDSAADEPTGVLVQRIRSLRLLAPVAVATGTPADCPALLAAGAVNVLRRSATAADLAARIDADLRWLGRAGGTAKVRQPDLGGGQLTGNRSQSLLLEILLGARGPLCCHDLRWLLGGASLPMTLPALRARVQRLAPHLARRGFVCDRDVRWGADTLTLRQVTAAAGEYGTAAAHRLSA